MKKFKNEVISDNLYKFAFNTFSEAILLLKYDMTIVFANEAASHYLGYSETELENLLITDVDIGITQAEWDLFWDVKRKDQITVGHDRIFKNKKGITFPVHIESTLFVYGDEEYSLNFIKDTSEKNDAFNRIKMLEKALELIPFEVYLKEHCGPRIQYVNQQVCKNTGYTFEELTQKMDIFDLAHNYTNEHLQAYRNALTENDTYRFEAAVRRKNGEVYPVEITSSRLDIDDTWYSISVAEDISERKRLEAEIKQHNENLETQVKQRTLAFKQAKIEAEMANKAKSTFLANMSHELRTPLNAVLGFSQLLNMDENLAERHHENVDMLIESGEHLLNLINDLLDMNKIEAGMMELDAVKININDILTTVTSLLKVQADQKNIPIEYKADNATISMIGDANRLKQVFINIIGNAIKFIESGYIQIQLSQSATNAVIKVIDTGPGISHEDQQRIFKPFEQVNPKQSINGTGLGLAISKSFIEKMGGKLSLTSELGVGTTFTISFPLIN